MPMNGKTMGDAAAAAMAGVTVDPTQAITGAQLAKVLEQMCTAIVSHITANALVTVPSLGLVSGAPGSPVTGAAQGTIT